MQKNKTYEFIKELLGPDATEIEIEEAIANFQGLLKVLWDMAERMEK
jgi:hypothetical protein